MIHHLAKLGCHLLFTFETITVEAAVVVATALKLPKNRAEYIPLHHSQYYHQFQYFVNAQYLKCFCFFNCISFPMTQSDKRGTLHVWGLQ